MDNLKGVICIDKPAGFTSFDVVAKLRGILKERRIGHSGTLDPQATGVLPVFIGGATKAISLLEDSDKSYTASFKLGMVSDTQDIFGTVTKTADVPSLTSAQLDELMQPLRGNIMQLPPMYSAVQVNGRRLYDLAREGIEVEREKRPVTVYCLELLSFDGVEGTLNIKCSKGTYIRTIINDIGEAIGCGAVMTGLRRTEACGFTLSDCTTLEALEKLRAEEKGFDDVILSTDKLFTNMRRIDLDKRLSELYRNGVRFELSRIGTDTPANGENFRVYDSYGTFIGIASSDTENGVLKINKNL